MSIWRWADRFTTTPAAFHITRGEGNTPLVRSVSIGPTAKLNNLWFKLESANPTGSYKDRFAAAAVSAMAAAATRHVVATSSGNTGAALAAYAAAARMTCEIAVVEPAPHEKLLQMMVYGARIYKVRGFGIDPQITARVFAAVENKGAAANNALQISAYRYSPLGMAGVETITHEILETLPATQHIFCPAGGGGLVLAVARGGVVARACGAETSPAVHCVQPAGNDTIATPLRRGDVRGRAVQCTSAISGLQVPGVIDADAAIDHCRRSGGSGHVVDDATIWAVQKRLAVEEGLFIEPAAAVSVAGALLAAAAGEVDRDAPIVCLLTGIGFKDQPALMRMVDRTCEMIEPIAIDYHGDTKPS